MKQTVPTCHEPCPNQGMIGYLCIELKGHKGPHRACRIDEWSTCPDCGIRTDLYGCFCAETSEAERKALDLGEQKGL